MAPVRERGSSVDRRASNQLMMAPSITSSTTGDQIADSTADDYRRFCSDSIGICGETHALIQLSLLVGERAINALVQLNPRRSWATAGNARPSPCLLDGKLPSWSASVPY